MAADGSARVLAAERASGTLSPDKWSILELHRKRISRHLALIKRSLKGTRIHANAEAIGLAVAVTDRELFIGRARLFGSKVERFSLNRLVHLRMIPTRSVNLALMEFAGTPPVNVTIMFWPDARAKFDGIVRTLQGHLQRRQTARRRNAATPAAWVAPRRAAADAWRRRLRLVGSRSLPVPRG